MDHDIEAHSTMMSVDINRAHAEQVFCATRSGEVFGNLGRRRKLDGLPPTGARPRDTHRRLRLRTQLWRE